MASQSPAEAPTKPLYCRSPHQAMQLAGLDGQQHPDLSKVRDPWINLHLNAYMTPLLAQLEVGSPCLQPHLFLIFQWMVFKVVTGFLIQANVGPLSKKAAAKGLLRRYRLEAELSPITSGCAPERQNKGHHGLKGGG